jgi:hypothetical protein
MALLGDIGTQIADAFGNAVRVVFAWIPVLIGALLILLIGWIVASLVRALVLRLLEALHFDRVMAGTGMPEMMERGGVRADPARIVAGIIFWFVLLTFVLAAAKALGVEAITAIITAVVLWLPNLLVAVLILILGMLLARFVGDLVRTSMEAAGGQWCQRRLVDRALRDHRVRGDPRARPVGHRRGHHPDALRQRDVRPDARARAGLRPGWA